MTKQTNAQQLLFILWLSLIGYSLLLAPLAADELDNTLKILTMQNLQSNLVVFSLFSLMGLWPFIIAPLLLYTNRYKLRPWPFWIMSFALGFFAIAPYLAFRQADSSSTLPTRPHWWQWWRSKMLSGIYATFTAAIALGLLSLTVFYKDIPSFILLFNTYRFIHVMTLDFLALHCMSLYLISQDKSSDAPTTNPFKALPWQSSLIIIALPAFGPALYPILRQRYLITPKKAT